MNLLCLRFIVIDWIDIAMPLRLQHVFVAALLNKMDTNSLLISSIGYAFFPCVGDLQPVFFSELIKYPGRLKIHPQHSYGNYLHSARTPASMSSICI